jgi:hypothetical protein
LQSVSGHLPFQRVADFLSGLSGVIGPGSHPGSVLHFGAILRVGPFSLQLGTYFQLGLVCKRAISNVGALSPATFHHNVFLGWDEKH